MSVTSLAERRERGELLEQVAATVRELQVEVRDLAQLIPGAWRGAEFLTTADLERILNISERAARSLLSSGKIASYKVGGSRRIDPRDVDLYLAANRFEGGSA